MNIIKKIAMTASILLFVLAQVFSFYVVFISHKEKMELLRKKEGEFFDGAVGKFSMDLNRLDYADSVEDYAVIYCFRKNMMENSALYKGTRQLYNSSPYEFDVEKTNWQDQGYEDAFAVEKLNGRYILLFFSDYQMKWEGRKKPEKESYYLYYALDVTSIYSESCLLIAWEIFISVLASFGMAFFLTYRIKKITKPLQDANEAQRQLIGSLSHELKTPLTAIRGYSETLLGVKLTEEQKEKALRYIHLESGRLARLSEKMMELTRLYEPECRIAFSEVRVEELFEAVEESVRHRLLEKKMELVLEGAYQGMTKQIDSDLMTSFLVNLLNNSIMASEEGSRIYMGADETSIWVRDEGCGIPGDEIEKVRKAFYRVDKSRSRKSGNMGLGLALCEQIAAAHHGRMEIASKAGEGTKITFTNPLH